MALHTPTKLPRIERTTWNGRAAWIKRKEVLTGRLRFQKGDPAKAFDVERAIYAELAELDLPGPDVLSQSDDQMIIADAGPTLRSIIRDPGDDPEVVRRGLMASAKALAVLHQNGRAHGRPAPKDICLRGTQVTFIDWERAHPKRNRPKGYADDIIIFVFNAIADARGRTPDLDNAYRSYLENAPADVPNRIVGRLKHLKVLRFAMSPVLGWLTHKAEFAAIYPTIDLLTTIHASTGIKPTG